MKIYYSFGFAVSVHKTISLKILIVEKKDQSFGIVFFFAI